ncbi:MAG TPA: hypothetical protein VJL84_10115 [Kiloniellales bacterium]|nr:hypothetical protein [Kiloniellales bacterium]
MRRLALAAILLALLTSGGEACGTVGAVQFFLDSLWRPGGSYALAIERERLLLQLQSEKAGDGELTLKLVPQDALVLAEKGPADDGHFERVAGLIGLQIFSLAEGVVRQHEGPGLFSRLVFSVISPGEVFAALVAGHFALYDRKVVRDWKPGSPDYMLSVALELAVPDPAGRPCFLGAILETYRLGDSYRRVALFQVVDARRP